MTARGDDRKLMHWIASHGYTVVRAGSGHWKIFVDILPRMNAGDSRISRFGFLFATTRQEGRGR